ncbi:hypothetical protein V7111_07305 [Neobacillus niacini]|uniref:hypothetical protein n=1 Tax=Neobacillus niacini TaxID=86668 RepID=UPI003000D7CA
MKLYHVAVDSSTAEVEALRQVKPPRLLLSYFYFRNKPLGEYIEKIGYTPEIILDSGAWSAYNKGKGIALTEYLKYIEENKEYIHKYFSLDVIFDSQMSYRYWQIMKEKGYNPIPVFHYGEEAAHLKRYVEQTDYIGLGGTVTIKDKNEVGDWVRMITWQYPDKKFHLLGSSSDKIISTCDLESTDSSTWFMQAIMGKPKHIKGTSREAKIERAIFNLKRELEIYASLIVPSNDCSSQYYYG